MKLFYVANSINYVVTSVVIIISWSSPSTQQCQLLIANWNTTFSSVYTLLQHTKDFILHFFNRVYFVCSFYYILFYHQHHLPHINKQKSGQSVASNVELISSSSTPYKVYNKKKFLKFIEITRRKISADDNRALYKQTFCSKSGIVTSIEPCNSDNNSHHHKGTEVK